MKKVSIFLRNNTQLQGNMSDKWNAIKLMIHSQSLHQIILGIYLFSYLVSGLWTELRFMEVKPLPGTLLQDFGYYERALGNVLIGQDPYANRAIGPGFLYPAPALLIVEIFSHIEPLFLKASVYWVVNITLLSLIVLGIIRYFNLPIKRTWYWFVLCLGFAPLLETLHMGQINIITLFGIFMLFFWEEKKPILAGIGLGIAAITKVTPIFFIAYLVANRRFSVIVSGLSAILVLISVTVLRYGFAPVLTYPDVFLWLLDQFPMGPNSQSLVSKLAIADSHLFPTALSVLPRFLQSPISSIFIFFTMNYEIIHRILTVYILFAIVASGLLVLYNKQPKEPLFIITSLGILLSPNVMWYHHYVFILLPLLIWMGWTHLKTPIVVWCLTGFLIIQLDRYLPPYGLLIHIFGHLSLLVILLWQTGRWYAWHKHRYSSKPG